MNARSTKFYILFFFISLLVFTNVIFLRGLTDETLVPRFTFASVVLVLFTILFLPKLNSGKLSYLSLGELGMVLYYVVALLSCLWANNVPEALYATQKIPILIGVYFLSKYLLQRNFKWGLHMILLCALGYVFVVLITAIPQINEIRESYRIDRRTIQRVIGFSGTKNILSGTLLLLLPYMLMGIRWFKSWIRYLFPIAILGTLYILFTLQTRAVFLAAVVMIATIFFLWIVVNRKTRKPLLVIFFLLPLLSLVGFITSLATGTLDAMVSSTLAMEPNTNTGTWLERLAIWSKSFELYLEHPILGVGAGNWSLEFPLTGLEGISKAEEFSAFIARPHNDYIWILTELGLLGMLAYLIMWWGFLRGLFKRLLAHSGKTPWLVIFTISGLVAYLLFSFFSFPKERIEFSVLFGIMLALTAYFTKEQQVKIRLNHNFTIPGQILLVIALLFNVYLGTVRLGKERNSNQIELAFRNNEFEKVKELNETAKNPLYNMSPVGTPIAFYQGMIALSENQYTKAITYFDEAKKSNPGFLGNYINAGVAHYYSGSFDTAMIQYETAMKIAPNNSDLNYNLALLYIAMHDFGKAKECAEKLPDIDERKYRVLEKLE